MNNLRIQRVRELLKREIGEAIRREFHVNECGLISVNDVDVGGDFKSAVVFISIFGNAEQQKRGIQMSTNIASASRHRGKSVVLKYTLTLKFVFDDSIVRGNKVLQIIEELEKSTPVATDPRRMRNPGRENREKLSQSC